MPESVEDRNYAVARMQSLNLQRQASGIRVSIQALSLSGQNTGTLEAELADVEAQIQALSPAPVSGAA